MSPGDSDVGKRERIDGVLKVLYRPAAEVGGLQLPVQAVRFGPWSEPAARRAWRISS